MTRFFAMGGYGGFVWSAYAISAVLLIGALALTLRDYFLTRAQFRRMQLESDVPSS
jgi:heme exporter protein CcmD